MRRKRRSMLIWLSCLVLTAFVGIGATLAYFTDKAEVTNIMKTGKVDIELDEPVFSLNPDYTVQVMPGSVVKKDPTVTVASGSADAYLRIRITLAGTDGTSLDTKWQQEMLPALMDRVYETYGEADGRDVLFRDSPHWAEATDGFYYYTSPGNTLGAVRAGEVIPIFETVVIPAEWDNRMAEKRFTLAIQAQAIQAEGVIPTRLAGKIIGWDTAASQAPILTYP